VSGFLTNCTIAVSSKKHWASPISKSKPSLILHCGALTKFPLVLLSSYAGRTKSYGPKSCIQLLAGDFPACVFLFCRIADSFDNALGRVSCWVLSRARFCYRYFGMISEWFPAKQGRICRRYFTGVAGNLRFQPARTMRLCPPICHLMFGWWWRLALCRYALTGLIAWFMRLSFKQRFWYTERLYPFKPKKFRRDGSHQAKGWLCFINFWWPFQVYRPFG